ncbi:hypothetical protein [Bradyrhizobium sp. STM 3561]|uniref:hypothetical protein n=1 Tax=Bradyrhizobium sp. STM 3561 TaxID=578923 RepID=UPI00388D157A
MRLNPRERRAIVPILGLTDPTVQSLKPGLYMNGGARVWLAGRQASKAWIVLKEPNRTKIRLGHYPDLKLAEARRRAFLALGTPVGEKEISIVFEQVKLVFIEQNYKDKAARIKSETLHLPNRLNFRRTLAALDDAMIERELGKLADVPMSIRRIAVSCARARHSGDSKCHDCTANEPLRTGEQ